MDLSSEALAALDRQDARVKRWKLANGWPTLPPFFFVTSHGKSLA